MRKTGSKKIRFKKIFLLPICVSKTILIVLQSARRVNDDLAARLNIFHDRDHLLLWNSDASAGRAVFCGSILWFPPRRRSRHSRWRTNPRSIAIPENNAKNSAPQSVNYCVTDFRRTPVRLQICSLQFALCSTAFFALFSSLAIGSVRLIFRRINRCRTNQRAA